jgi:hypothetical protein
MKTGGLELTIIAKHTETLTAHTKESKERITV